MAVKLDYTFAADAIAEKAGVPDDLLSALINAESSWNPNAVSPTGATGLGQFTTGAATDYGLMGPGFDNRKDAALNLTATVKYLADLKAKSPTWRAAVGHYSGQGEALAKYAGYSAGRVLIAVVDNLDGTTSVPIPVPPPPADPPPVPPPDPPPSPPATTDTILMNTIEASGRGLQIIARRGSAAMTAALAMMIAGLAMTQTVTFPPLPMAKAVPALTCVQGDLRWLLIPTPCR